MEKATVQSIDRALSIVEALAGEKEGLGVTEISTRVGLHKSTVHRLLSALGERGFSGTGRAARRRRCCARRF